MQDLKYVNSFCAGKMIGPRFLDPQTFFNLGKFDFGALKRTTQTHI